MRPMGLYESKESNGTIGLKELFNSPANISAINELELKDIAFAEADGQGVHLWKRILL